jgi:uncharacterized membrane protein YhaH (DUF805 family)
MTALSQPFMRGEWSAVLGAGLRLLVLVVALVSIALYWSLALSVRRCHDIGISGGYVILLGVPIVNLFSSATYCLAQVSNVKMRGDPYRPPNWEI